jgi:hypothetical protein
MRAIRVVDENAFLEDSMLEDRSLILDDDYVDGSARRHGFEPGCDVAEKTPTIDTVRSVGRQQERDVEVAVRPRFAAREGAEHPCGSDVGIRREDRGHQRTLRIVESALHEEIVGQSGSRVEADRAPRRRLHARETADAH